MRKEQNQEWLAWRQVCKQLEALDHEVNTTTSNPLIRAMRLWGEELHALRHALPEYTEKALEDARRVYEPHRLADD